VVQLSSTILLIVTGASQVLVKPRTTEEMSAVLKHCNNRNLAVVPQVVFKQSHELVKLFHHTYRSNDKIKKMFCSSSLFLP